MSISLKKLSLDEKINMRTKETNRDLTNYSFKEALKGRFRKDKTLCLSFQKNKLEIYYKRSARG